MTRDVDDLRSVILASARASAALQEAAGVLEARLADPAPEAAPHDQPKDATAAPTPARVQRELRPPTAPPAVVGNGKPAADHQHLIEPAKPADTGPEASPVPPSATDYAASAVPVREPMTLDDLHALLHQRGVALGGHHVPVPADEPLDRLAEELAQGLHRLGDLPQVLRRPATTHHPQTLRLRDDQPTSLTASPALPPACTSPDCSLMHATTEERAARTCGPPRQAMPPWQEPG